MADQKSIILLLLTFALLHVDALFIKSKSINLKSNHLMVDNGFQSSLSFGSCEKVHHSSSKLVCKLHLETNEPVESTRHVQFCEVSIDKEADREIVTLNERRVLLVSKYSDRSFSLLIVNFPDCGTVPIEIDDNLKANKIKVISGPSEGLFDVLLVGEKGSCSKINRCGMTIDFDGHIRVNLEEWIDDRIHILTYMYKSYGEGLVADYVDKTDEHKLRVLSYDKYGFLNVLKEYPLYETPGLRSLASVSTTHQFLTVCTRNYTAFTCGQFNSLGKQTLDAEFQLGFGKLHSVHLHNLPYGGFLMLITECTKNDDDCAKSNDDFYVMKIDKEGNVANTLEITDYRCKYGLELNRTSFFIDKHEQHCLSYLCGANNMYAQLHLDDICFLGEELEYPESSWGN